MAWIESHQSLKEHPKLFWLMDLLSITRVEAIGHLHMLWWWCIDYAPNGNLERFQRGQVGKAAEWPHDAGLFVEALLETGFLESGPLRIHDWQDFCGTLMDKRLMRMASKRPPDIPEWMPNGNQRADGVKDVTAVKDVTPTSLNTNIIHTDVTSTAVTPYRIPEPKQEPAKALVMAYKVLLGIAYDDAEWDVKVGSKMMVFAIQILKRCGTFESAYACLRETSEPWIKSKLTAWTLKGVSDRATEWKARHGGKEHGDANSARFFEALNKQRNVETKNPGLGKADPRQMLSRIRDLQSPGPQAGAGNGRPGNGHEKPLASVHGGRVEGKTTKGEE